MVPSSKAVKDMAAQRKAGQLIVGNAAETRATKEARQQAGGRAIGEKLLASSDAKARAQAESARGVAENLTENGTTVHVTDPNDGSPRQENLWRLKGNESPETAEKIGRSQANASQENLRDKLNNQQIREARERAEAEAAKEAGIKSQTAINTAWNAYMNGNADTSQLRLLSKTPKEHLTGDFVYVKQANAAADKYFKKFFARQKPAAEPAAAEPAAAAAEPAAAEPARRLPNAAERQEIAATHVDAKEGILRSGGISEDGKSDPIRRGPPPGKRAPAEKPTAAGGGGTPPSKDPVQEAARSTAPEGKTAAAAAEDPAVQGESARRERFYKKHPWLTAAGSTAVTALAGKGLWNGARWIGKGVGTTNDFVDKITGGDVLRELDRKEAENIVGPEAGGSSQQPSTSTPRKPAVFDVRTNTLHQAAGAGQTGFDFSSLIDNGGGDDPLTVQNRKLRNQALQLTNQRLQFENNMMSLAQAPWFPQRVQAAIQFAGGNGDFESRAFHNRTMTQSQRHKEIANSFGIDAANALYGKQDTAADRLRGYNNATKFKQMLERYAQ